MASSADEAKSSGLADRQGLSSGSYASQSRDVIALVNRFRATGAHFDLDLPTVVFVGDQSTGKSSLLEALSGIEFPRADGTCTRCPTELRMTESAPGSHWECQIRLRWEFDDLRQQKHLNVREEPFGEVITDPEQVQDAVARAQLALLNPHIASAEFWKLPREKLIAEGAEEENMDVALVNPNAKKHILPRAGKVSFSRNVVCVDIRGPNVSNLALIDLPGIIRSSDRADEKRNVYLIKGMVKDYTLPQNAIVVALVSCKQEMEHTVVRDIAREADPNGERTIGVLTKPDRLERGAWQSKLDVLQGKTYRLELGYYCVKNRSPEQLLQGMSFEEARADERRFFDTQEPWNQLPAHIRNRLGVDSLEQKLTELLTRKIVQAMPQMKRKTGQLLQVTRNMLKQIAPPIPLAGVAHDGNLSESGYDVRMTLLSLIRDFIDALKEVVAAQTGSKDLWRAVHSHMKEFCKQLKRTRPGFTFKKNKSTGRLMGGSGSEDDAHPQQQQGGGWFGFGKKSSEGAPATPQQQQQQQQQQQGAPQQGGAQQQQQGQQQQQSAPQPPLSPAGGDGEDGVSRMYTFDEVRRLIESERGRQIPGMGGNAPYEAKTRLIMSFLEQWRGPAQECVSRVNHSLTEAVRKIIRERLGRFVKLQGAASDVLSEFMAQLEQQTRDTVNMLIEMELHNPFTLNSEYFEKSKHKIMKSLRQTAFAPQRQAALAAAQQAIAAASKAQTPAQKQEMEVAQALQALNRIGISGYNANTIQDLAYMPITPQDKQLDEVLEVVAEVLAYFKVAFKRFADNVPMVIDHQFLMRFSSTLDSALIQRLNLLEADKDSLSELLDEDPRIVKQRKELRAREERLQQVWKELQKFGIRDA